MGSDNKHDANNLKGDIYLYIYIPGTRKLFVFMVHFQIHYDFHLYPNSIVNFQQKWSTFLMYHQPSFFSHAQQQEVWIKRWVRSFQLEFLGSSDMENIRKYRADTCPNHYIYIS